MPDALLDLLREMGMHHDEATALGHEGTRHGFETACAIRQSIGWLMGNALPALLAYVEASDAVRERALYWKRYDAARAALLAALKGESDA